MALLATGLGLLASPGASGTPRGDGQTALSRLRTDSEGSATFVRRGGAVRFVGTAAGRPIANPAVSASDSVLDAARAHIGRYGSALGVVGRGLGLVEHRTIRTVAGTDTVRLRQTVRGLPVVGGDVVVSMDADRNLVSMLATASRGAVIGDPRIDEEQAREIASLAHGRPSADVQVESQDRWVLDPAVAGTTGGLGARSVWRFEVSDQRGRREVFVDDQTGSILMSMDDLHTVNRVVCDNDNASQAFDVACTSGFSRSEGQGAAADGEVNSVYDFTGATDAFYAAVGVDLTDLIGIDTTAGKALASTVQWCYTGETCPFPNAFWNGSQMYYGQGYAGADDVVGHELTHGVTDRTSELLYWGQSGAINESISDIMGEFVDHRTGVDDNSAWALGEDVPDFAPDGLRNLKDPTLFDDPDSTQSPHWYRLVADPACGFYYCDNGWVHLNSGVGNKTAYLIAKGGTFGGQSIIGIDADNETYVKSGRLWQLVNESLSSGSDYGDLAEVLDQACTTLRSTAGTGFTAENCANVSKAALATRLRDRPPADPRAADASGSCPAGYAAPVVLFDSETGNPNAKFTAAGAWTRIESPIWGSNANSGQDSWHNSGPFSNSGQAPRSEALAMAGSVTVPPVNKTYLRFFHWDQLDYEIDVNGTQVAFYDGGTVEIDDLSDPSPALDAAGLPWVNGPARQLSSVSANPAGGRFAFSGESYGYLASRVDLSAFAGKPIQARFSLNFDNAFSFIGWFVDDVQIYTCQPKVIAGKVALSGKPRVGKKLTAKTPGWTAGTKFTYQWLKNGKKIKGAKSKTYQVKSADRGKKISVKVTGKKTGFIKAVKKSKSLKVK
jgi:bacillolysin